MRPPSKGLPLKVASGKVLSTAELGALRATVDRLPPERSPAARRMMASSHGLSRGRSGMGASSTLPVLPRMTPNEEVCEMRKRIEVERCAAMRSCSQREFSEHMSLPFVVHRAREEERRMVHGYVPPATGECGKRGAHWQSNESVGALLFDSVKARRQDKDRARVRDLRRVLTVERAKRAELERSVARLMRPRTESASAPMLVPRDPFKRYDMLGAMPSRKASPPQPPSPRVPSPRAHRAPAGVRVADAHTDARRLDGLHCRQ